MLRSAPRYETVRPLGEGATSRVTLVRLTAPFRGMRAGTLLARKELAAGLEDDARARHALLKEGELARDFHARSLAHCVYVGHVAARPFLLFNYVDGRDLADVLADGTLPEPQVRAIGRQLAEALAVLHDSRLAHGDVKPANVRLAPTGEAVLLDLGFAARLDEAISSPTAHAGSLAYLSPERARGGPPDPASDVYALGVLCYELVTGVHPHGAPSSAQPRVVGLGRSSGELLRQTMQEPDADRLLADILRGRVLAPSRLCPGLTPFLDALLLEMLARSPRGRPSAGELAERLATGEAGAWWRSRVTGNLGRARGAGAAPAWGAGGHLLPLVGREAELARLATLMEEVRTGARTGSPESRVVWLAGPEGSGKWRLVHEFAARARESLEPPLYLYARWTETAEARPGGALLLLLHRWLQLPLGSAPDDRTRSLLRTLLAPAQERVLSAALALDEDEAPRESVGTALAAWLQALSRERPCLVFLDDLHYARRVTLGALSSLVGVLREANVLLILGMREDLRPSSPERLERLHERLAQVGELSSRAAVETLSLPPMAEADIGLLVDELFHRTAPRLRLTRVLWERSRGNPGLLSEILRALSDHGQIRPRTGGGGRLELTIPPDDIPLPGSLDRMIAERFQSLDAGDRVWLERLSVVGGRIDAEFLRRTFGPASRSEIDAVLARLVRAGWLVPRGARYRFARPALREAVYRTLGELRRRRLHQAAGRGLEAEEGAESGVDARFQRAFHLRAARDHEALLACALPLIGELRGRASHSRVYTLTRWVLEALENLPEGPGHAERLLEVIEAATDAADRLGMREEERHLLDRLADLEERGQLSKAQVTRVYLLHGRYAAGTGQFGLARGMLRNACLAAEESGETRLISEAERRLALVQAQIGEFDEAQRLADQAFEHASDEGQGALAELAAALLDILLDRPEAGLERTERALATLEGLPRPPLGVVAHANLLRARIWRSAGRPGLSLGTARRAVRLAGRAGERRLEIEARARLGGYLLDLDRVEPAEAYLRDALFAAREIEDRRGQTLASLFLGVLLWENDDTEAEASIRGGLELARSIGFYRAEAVGLALLARVERAREHLVEAAAAAAEAVEHVERHGAELADRILIVGTHALVLSTVGRKREAAVVSRGLRARVAAANRRVRDPELRRGQRTYEARLLRSVLSPEGPVFPRRKEPARES